MSDWVALLRAVNLGARNKVPMAELRALLERDGFADVRTYIASGNVLFRTDAAREAAARRVEELIASSFGVETTAILRTPAELAAVVAGHPFGADTSRSHVSFLAAEPSPADVERAHSFDAAPERVVVAGADAYLLYPGGTGRAQLNAARLEKLLGVEGTTRNWRTVEALLELVR